MYSSTLEEWDDHYIELKKIILNNIKISVANKDNNLTFVILLKKTDNILSAKRKNLITEMIQSYLLEVFVYEVINPSALFAKYTNRLDEPEMLQAAKDELKIMIKDYAGDYDEFYKLIWDYIEYNYDINPNYLQLS